MSEIEATISRISSYEGVDRILIIKSIETEDSINSIVMRSLTNNKNNDLKRKTKRRIICQNCTSIRKGSQINDKTIRC